MGEDWELFLHEEDASQALRAITASREQLSSDDPKEPRLTAEYINTLHWCRKIDVYKHIRCRQGVIIRFNHNRVHVFSFWVNDDYTLTVRGTCRSRLPRESSLAERVFEDPWFFVDHSKPRNIGWHFCISLQALRTAIRQWRIRLVDVPVEIKLVR